MKKALLFIMCSGSIFAMDSWDDGSWLDLSNLNDETPYQHQEFDWATVEQMLLPAQDLFDDRHIEEETVKVVEGAEPDSKKQKNEENPDNFALELLMKQVLNGKRYDQETVRDKEICKTLLAHGATIPLRGDNEEPWLYQAIRKKLLDVSLLLIKAGADVHEKSKGGISALSAAVRLNLVEVCRAILEKGGDPLVVDKRNNLIPFNQARSKDMLRLLIPCTFLIPDYSDLEFRGKAKISQRQAYRQSINEVIATFLHILFVLKVKGMPRDVRYKIITSNSDLRKDLFFVLLARIRRCSQSETLYQIKDNLPLPVLVQYI